MRKYIQGVLSFIIAVLFILGGVMLAKILAGSKPELPKAAQGGVATIFTTKVINGNVPISVNATGQLMALNRLDLFSEVQGVMLPDNGKFKAANRFQEGENLLNINAADFKANLVSQRSNLLNLITSSLADLRLDFPDAFDNWNSYAQAFNIYEMVSPLPVPSSEKEKLFISGRQILSTFHTIKNAELVLGKYNLRAPFDGILVEATVNPGTVIRPGQKLGSFIDPTVFELEAPISSEMISYLKVGQSVKLKSTNNSKRTWTGKLQRINSLVDPSTQTMNAYIRVVGKGLEEGMFLELSVDADKIPNAFELPREVVFNENEIYTTDGNKLIQTKIEPVFFTENTVIVKGLSNGTQVLTKIPPSAYPGMEVRLSNSAE